LLTTLRDNDKGFRFIRQKPVNLAKADSQPETFIFDSIRMYFYPPKSDLQDEYWENEVFEIQIKTLLDEAWSKASHDFTYKTKEELSWAKRRVVSQIKALLEHIEISLIELERISSSGLLTKEYDEATKNNEIIAVYKYFWSDEFLPKNLKRLAENTIRVLKIFNLTKDDLEKILNDESSNGRGNKLMNLSPYWILIQSLINIKGWDHFQSKFKPKDKKFPLIKELNIGSIPLEEALSSNNELKSKFIIR